MKIKDLQEFSDLVREGGKNWDDTKFDRFCELRDIAKNVGLIKTWTEGDSEITFHKFKWSQGAYTFAAIHGIYLADLADPEEDDN